MHDVTEGGLLWAIWESSYYYHLWVNIEYDKIFISEANKFICEHYKIGPLRLISSGTMLIISAPENVNSIIETLKENNILAFDIGVFTENKKCTLIKENKEILIDPPESDELYKVVWLYR